MTSGSIQLFGPPQLQVNQKSVLAAVPVKGLVLLAYLFIEGGEHLREILAANLWSEVDPGRARGNLRTLLYDLGKQLPDLLEVGRKSVALKDDHAYACDILELKSALEISDPDRQSALLEAYRGDLLAGISLSDAPEMNEWIFSQQEIWRLRLLESLETLFKRYQATGNAQGAVEALRRQIRIEPWRESSQLALMQQLARQGQLAEALRQYEQLRKTLAEELGVEPSAETAAFHHKLQNARTRPRADLPAAPTALIGRQAEITQIGDLLADPDRRLITLLGPGGIGKTRLALEAANSLAFYFLEGVYFIPLVAVRPDESLISALISALKVQASGGQDPREALIGFCEHREALIVLDNFEHLSEQAGLLAELLEAAPALKLLVTSRQRLELRAETVLNVEGLAFPQAGAVSANGGYPALRLFAETASRVDSQFQLQGHEAAVAKICGLVDGFPLAIELAAARADQLTLEQILAHIEASLDAAQTRYRDVPQRHRSLRAVFDYSWQLLAAEAQIALSRLTVFSGGFSAAAAAAVAEASSRVLSQLHNQSLLQFDGQRYDMHALVRQYAAEALMADADQEMEKRHRAYFANFVRDWQAQLYQVDQAQAIQTFERDLDNIRQAWDAAAENSVEQVAAMLPGLARFYDATSLSLEGDFRFEKAAAQVQEQEQSAGLVARIEANRMRCLNMLGNFDKVDALTLKLLKLDTLEDDVDARVRLEAGWAGWRRGLMPQSRGYLEPALEAARRAEHPQLIAHCLRNLGIIDWYAGEYEKARELTQMAIDYHEMINDQQGVADSYNNLGLIYGNMGEYGISENFLEKSLAIKQTIGDRRGAALTLGNLGTLAIYLGDFARADERTEEALPIISELGDLQLEAHTLANYGFQGVYQQDDYSRVHMIREALSLAVRIRDRYLEAFALQYLAHIHARQKRYSEAEAVFLESLAIRRELELPEYVAEVLQHLIPIASAQGEHAKAETLLAELLELLEANQIPTNRIQLGALLAVHQYLDEVKDERAGNYLEQAHQQLMKEAETIRDPKIRQGFLKNVPVNRDIIAAYAAHFST
jgi:predicted ATPase/DNA-binding SARP family transcriptional activator